MSSFEGKEAIYLFIYLCEKAKGEIMLTSWKLFFT